MAEKPAPAAAGSDDFFRALDTQLLVHELKGPLSLIEAAARTLIEQAGRMGPLTERQEKTVKRILRGTLRGRRLVNQLLEIGRAESAQFSLASFDVGEAVLKVFRCSQIRPRTPLLETNGSILLIASYYLLKNICHLGALEDVFPRCFPFCQAMKNRIRGRVTDRIE